MQDYLIRVLTTNKQLRALAVKSTNLIEKARKSHHTTPVATAALGRALSGVLMMASLVKSGEEVSLIIEGDGPIEKIVVEANQYGEVRGYVKKPVIDFVLNNHKKLDVASAVGKGQMKVIKNKLLKKSFESTVPLVSGEIGDDLTYYFSQSEQTPSAVGLGVLINKDLSVKAAGGFMVQLLPDADENTISKLEDNLGKIESVSRLIEAGKSPEELLEIVLTGFDFRVMERKDVYYRCKCNRERIAALLNAFDEKEIKEILEKEGRIEVRCHFCNQSYEFSPDDFNPENER